METKDSPAKGSTAIRLIAAAALAALLTSCGCSGGARPIEPVKIAGDAGSQAIALYDKSGDGALDDAELSGCPALLKRKAVYDTDADGRVSASEIDERIAAWQSQGMGIRALNVLVRLDGRPLAGATVRFVPEEFLGSGPKPASGVTDSSGGAKIGVAKDDLPEDLQKAMIRGIYGGLYKIQISHPQRKIPSKYGDSTTLGEEIARDTTPDRLELDLRSQ
jgi:hypothetical protein